MTPDLHPVLQRYFAAENAGNVEALAACFTHDATVLDEGRTIRGRAAIAEWMRHAKAAYQHSTEPVAIVEREGCTVVTTRVAGTFPGSPVELENSFRIEGALIAALEIH